MKPTNENSAATQAVATVDLLAELEAARRRLKKLRLTLEKGECGRSYCDVWEAEGLIEKVLDRERSHSANNQGQPTLHQSHE